MSSAQAKLFISVSLVLMVVAFFLQATGTASGGFLHQEAEALASLQ